MSNDMAQKRETHFKSLMVEDWIYDQVVAEAKNQNLKISALVRIMVLGYLASQSVTEAGEKTIE